MILTTINGTYVNSRTLGEYPNATVEYIGERHLINKGRFIFLFELKNKDGIELSRNIWSFGGVTASGNTIQNEGELVVFGGTSGETTTDFVTYVMGGGDLEEPTLEVITMPSLSYDDIDNYFIMGAKKDAVQLPSNVNAKRLVKWLLLKTLLIDGEPAGNQFQF